MVNLLKPYICGAAVLFATLTLAPAQTKSPPPAPNSSPNAKAVTPPLPTAPSTKTSDSSQLLMVQASTTNAAPSPTTAATTSTTTTQATTAGPVEPDSVTENGGVGVREFQGDDVGQVLRLLARQAKINLVVSEAVIGTVTMRLEDVTAFQAIETIIKAKGLFMDKIDSVYYVKTDAERAKEPTESDSYQFSYARAKEVAPLIGSQLASKEPPQVDERTNTMFFRETRSNI